MQPFYDEGGVTIYHGDCREILPALPIEGAVVVTDPPYGIGWKKGENKAAGSRRHAGIANDEDTSARDEALALLEGKPAIVFGSFYAPQPADVKQILVWAKPADAGLVGSVTGYRRDAEPVFLVGPWPKRNVAWSSVLRPGARSIAATATETGHPHTKPLALLRELIERTPPLADIVDPFMGSGTTLLAARQLGRRAIGIEISEEFCQRAVERLGQTELALEPAA